MTKTEQNRVLAWRLKLLREASVTPRSVAQTCRHFGLPPGEAAAMAPDSRSNQHSLLMRAVASVAAAALLRAYAGPRQVESHKKEAGLQFSGQPNGRSHGGDGSAGRRP